MPQNITPEDKPVVLAIDMSTQQTTYVVSTAKGVEIARFAEQVDANDYVASINEGPKLIWNPERDSGTERLKRIKPKGRQMPRGIPKKKAKKAVKKAAAVTKKAAKKVMKRRKRRATA